uniref:Peptidase S1 domain-containing protein n=1 Tax=Trichuris muris TaxID=70415 RepID=A0A5S6QS58_TRIMR
MSLNAALLSTIIWISAFVPETFSYECGYPKSYGGDSIDAYVNNAVGDLAFPWTVAIIRNYRKYICLGSIVPEAIIHGHEKNCSRIVLTAGSCFRSSHRKAWKNVKKFRVIAGIQRYSKFSSQGYKGYPKFVRVTEFRVGNNKHLWNGVAAIYLKKPLLFNKFISPVCAADQKLIPESYEKCYVTYYHKKRLIEKPVNLILGSVCNFGLFPELANIGGLCAFNGRRKEEKYVGAPLVCMYQGRAYQYGIYLTDLERENKLGTVKESFHYFASLFPFSPNGTPRLPTVTLGSRKESSTSTSGSTASSISSLSSESKKSISGYPVVKLENVAVENSDEITQEQSLLLWVRLEATKIIAPTAVSRQHISVVAGSPRTPPLNISPENRASLSTLSSPKPVKARKER